MFQQPRLYADVNKIKPKEYSDYENYENAWGFHLIFLVFIQLLFFSYHSNADDYEIMKKIGRGKYSDVFEGISVKKDIKVIIKILKPGS